MKIKGYIKRTIKLLSLVVVVVVCFWFLQQFFFSNADNNAARLQGFYMEDKDSIDVVFLGASEGYYDLAPGYAYDQYGITSYSYGTPSTTIRNYKTMLKEILRTQDPQLIFVDLNGAFYDKDDLLNDIHLRNYTDHLPLNANKVELINKCVEGDKLEYYFPLVKFHAVWRNYPSGLGWTISLLENRFRGYSPLKGIRSKAEMPKFGMTNLVHGDYLEMKAPLEEQSEQELRDFLQYCKDENVNVVFGRMPHIIQKVNLQRFQRSNTAKEIVESYGFDFICFDVNDTNTELDINHDFFNQEHLNVYGQQKVTDIFYRYLFDHYALTPSSLTDKQKEEWKDCARYYYAYFDYAEYKYQNGETDYVCEDYRNMKMIKKFLTPLDEFQLSFEKQ